ncbi:MAG TPA: molybdenum cofactor guanylyltransferase MobA [Xanthobacteraceae bacterium]|nr:molybdenum cofactor guanylyltransferase MobA [Xanthobacteraceae bacterium]
MSLAPATVVLVLAGGRGRRMGGTDKARVHLAGQTLLERAVARLAPQGDALLVSANGDAARFASHLTMIPDDLPDHPGPLAGLLAGLYHIAAHHPAIAWMASAPVDCPFLPRDLVARLHAGRAGAPLARAASGGRVHPVAGLWPVALRHALRRALTEQGERRVGVWGTAQGAVDVLWQTAPYDPFFNVNTSDDLVLAEAILAAHPDA